MAKAYINAVIDRRKETAFLTDNGYFVKLGTDDEIRSMVQQQDEVIDLNGAFVVPGFIDTHMHLMNYGYYLSNLQLADCRSLEDVLEMVKQRAEITEKGNWIIGRGYNEELFTKTEAPTRAALDAISTDCPICLTRSCGHVMIANSKALELAGYAEDCTKTGVHMDTGRLEEEAISEVKKAWPSATLKDLEKYITLGAENVNRFGITTVGSDDFLSIVQDWKTVLDAFMKLSYQGKLNVRVNEQCEFKDIKDFVSFLDEGYTTGLGDEFFTIGPLKLILDGSLGARTAAMTTPYADGDTLGLLDYSDEDLLQFVQLANRFNMPTITHAIGDRALDQILNVFEEEVLPNNPLHHGIVHCQIMRKDQIQKCLDMKLNCYFQSLFIDDDAPILNARVGEERAKSCYPFKTLFEGTCASNGSDAPIEVPNPLKGIQLAVTRTSITDPNARLNPEECLSVEQAIDSYTINGAKAFGMEDLMGRIEEGYYADFAVLDRNITECDVNTIKDASVILTVVNGQPVYKK